MRIFFTIISSHGNPFDRTLELIHKFLWMAFKQINYAAEAEYVENLHRQVISNSLCIRDAAIDCAFNNRSPFSNPAARHFRCRIYSC